MTTMHATSQTMTPGDLFLFTRFDVTRIAVFMYRTPVSAFTDRVTYHWQDDVVIRDFICSIDSRYELVLN